MYTKEQIRNLVRNSIFNCIDDLEDFGHYWDTTSVKEKELVVEIMASYWEDKLDRVSAFREE